MSVRVDPLPAAVVRFLDASMMFHPVVNPAFADPKSFTVRRLAPKGRGR